MWFLLQNKLSKIEFSAILEEAPHNASQENGTEEHKLWTYPAFFGS